MYTILVTEQNELVTTVRERIMQRSKLVDNLHILVDQNYKGISMADCTVLLEYITPASREYMTEFLQAGSELYLDKLQYTLPFDTKLTREAGEIEFQLSFYKTPMDALGEVQQLVRKTSPTTVTIVPIAAWSNVIADNALTALDQRIIQMEVLLNATNDMTQAVYESKADNIVFDPEDSTIQLTAAGRPIGDRIRIAVSTEGGEAVDGLVDAYINEAGELLVVFADQSEKNLGRVVDENGKVYVPHVDAHKILSFTIEDQAGEIPEPVDLNPHDEWSNIDESKLETQYIWEPM